MPQIGKITDSRSRKLSEIKMIKKLQAQLQNQDLSASELIQNCFKKIDSGNIAINAFLSTFKTKALEQASRIDEKLKKGDPLSPLAGIPIAIKDNINIQGEKTTCASKMLENFKAPFSATVIEKLLDAGAIPVGKANMDEFAMGSSTEYSAFGPTKNPHNTAHVPGGSSGGSAAAVAADMVPISLGSDTGGSIRQPAAFCGVVGLKPTYGRVSRYGLVAFASSLDQIGPFAKTVEDAAILLNTISGFDAKDSTSEQVPVPDFTANLGRDIKGLKIGVPKELLESDACDEDTKAAFRTSLDQLKALGATWEPISLSNLEDAMSAYYIIAPAEASANLERYDGVRFTHRTKEASSLKEMIMKSRGEGFGSEVKRRIILGTYVLSAGYYDAYYLKAQKVRTLIKNTYKEAFNKYDLIATPTALSPAFKFGEMTNDPIAMYLSDLATIPVNLAGLPAISIPCGSSKTNLPIGLQLIGNHMDEATILKTAHALETDK